MMALEGQMTCFTGRPGCGKTLLLRVLMGFVPLDEGLVSIDGELVTALSASAFRRQMAYVPQDGGDDGAPGAQEKQKPLWRRTRVPQTDDLETVWSGEGLAPWKPTAIGQPVVTILDKPIVLADCPPTAMLSQLRRLADEGRTVVVTSREEACLNMSDKIITLGEYEHINT